MKKIVSLLIAVMMISTVAFGATIDSATAEYKDITVNYSGVASEYATVMVYQVGDDDTMPDYIEGTHKIVGLNQENPTGTFDIRLDNADYTGYLVAKVGGDGSNVKYNIKVVGGVPETVSTEIDCEGGTVTVGANYTLNIGDLKLLNAYVEAEDLGHIEYINKSGDHIDLYGAAYFDASGNLHSQSVEPITLVLPGADSSTFGFIWNADLDGRAGSYGYEVMNGSEAAFKGSFDIEEGLEGNVRFAVGVANVPGEVSLNCNVIGLQ